MLNIVKTRIYALILVLEILLLLISDIQPPVWPLSLACVVKGFGCLGQALGLKLCLARKR